MTALEIDLSQVQEARDVHVVWSTALGFPDWYGHNWDAFWDLICADHPLPDQLTIRGLDHLERLLPEEAEKMLACLEDYNNDTGHVCRSAVTDDYDTRMFLVRYEARPTHEAEEQDALGAFINCWIKAGSARAAKQIAVRAIEGQGWEVVRHEEVRPVTLRDLGDDEHDAFARQACIDGAVFDWHSWLEDE